MHFKIVHSNKIQTVSCVLLHSLKLEARTRDVTLSHMQRIYTTSEWIAGLMSLKIFRCPLQSQLIQLKNMIWNETERIIIQHPQKEGPKRPSTKRQLSKTKNHCSWKDSEIDVILPSQEKMLEKLPPKMDLEERTSFSVMPKGSPL